MDKLPINWCRISSINSIISAMSMSTDESPSSLQILELGVVAGSSSSNIFSQIITVGAMKKMGCCSWPSRCLRNNPSLGWKTLKCHVKQYITLKGTCCAKPKSSSVQVLEKPFNQSKGDTCLLLSGAL